MNIDTLQAVEQEAKRFLARLEALKKRVAAEGPECIPWGCKESAAVRRASLDLSRALSALRKPG